VGKVLVSLLMSAELKEKLDALKRENRIRSLSSFVEEAVREKLRREGLA